MKLLLTASALLILAAACSSPITPAADVPGPVPTAFETSATPVPSPVPASPTATPRPTATSAPAPTSTPLATATPVPTATPQPIPTAIPTPTATPVPTATPRPTPTATPTPTPSPSPTPTATPVPTATPQPTPTATPTPTPTPAPLGERSFADRPDDDDPLLHKIHAVYLLASDSADLERDTNGSIARSVKAIQSWFEGQTGGRTLRFDTFQGEPDVSFIRLNKDEFQILREGSSPWRLIQSELLLRGFDQPNRIYAVYYDGLSEPSVCGRGGTTGGRRIAVAHLTRSCPGALAGFDLKPKDADYTIIHEVLHTIGAVPSCAPNFLGESLRGHVDDNRNDIMWQFIVPDTFRRLDVGRNDYFDHNIDGCTDLADSPFLIESTG